MYHDEYTMPEKTLVAWEIAIPNCTCVYNIAVLAITRVYRFGIKISRLLGESVTIHVIKPMANWK